ncbi:MAG: VWA-like domain-containing protein [Lachnospiraceae bacterium]|nr:VWA-like domain-containing protein [Lachnospiraceae bacterium]
MEVSDQRLRKLTQKVLTSRLRLLNDHGFFGLLLMHAKFSLGEEYDTAWTDCRERIWINPDFLEALSERELDYVLMHEILHMVLGHSFRQKERDQDIFNIAADIVVNSNILKAYDGDEDAISLPDFGGVQMHRAADGKEGYLYTTEEIYAQLAHIIMPEKDGRQYKSTVWQAVVGVEDSGQQKSGRLQNDGGQQENDSRKQDRLQKDGGQKNENERKEGRQEKDDRKKPRGESNKDENPRMTGKGWDHHEIPEVSLSEDAEKIREEWNQRIVRACEALSLREGHKGIGSIPAFARRYYDKLKNPRADWRTVLNEFIQEEVNDYSFLPPDKRFSDTPFFLPDFNDKDIRVEKVLFMIDTSGSMTTEEITACYSEIRGAIDQFNGRLEGWLGFFDAAVTEPKPFADVDELLLIEPKGGGGTSFAVVFDYVGKQMTEDPPVCIVILTDGVARFPKEEAAGGIPVLWVINNEKISPPWGKVTRITA